MDSQIINYDKLILILKSSIKLYIKDKYFMIMIPKLGYHISIFRDQWDEYKSKTNRNYHLFHITSNDANNKCSTYYYVDLYTNRIKKIPNEYFLYNQDTYGFYSSTRSQCEYKLIKPGLKYFQKILNSINNSK